MHQTLKSGIAVWRCSMWPKGCRAYVKAFPEEPIVEVVEASDHIEHPKPTVIRNTKEIEYLPSGKKYPIMVFENYVYKRIKVNRSGKVFWRCTRCHKGCMTYCIVGDTEVEVRHQHNHDPPKCRTKTGRWKIDKKKDDEDEEDSKDDK